MIITEIGVVWASLMIMASFFKFNYSVLLTLISIVFQSVSFCYGDIITLSIFEICTLLLLARCLFIPDFKIILSRQSRWLLLFCASTTITSIISLYLFQGMEIPLFTEEIGYFYMDGYYNLGFNNSFFFGLLRLWLYSSIFVIIQTYSTIYNNKYDTAVCTFRISFCIVSVVGIIQYLGIFDRSLYDIVKLFHSINLERGSAFYASYDKLYSSFREPSYCGLWLSATFFALLTIGKKSLYTILAIGLSLIGIILSFSTTAFGVMVFMSAYSLAKNSYLKRRPLGLLIVSLLAVLFFGFTAEGQRWLFELANKMTSTSGIGRLTYIKLCYNVFFETYGLGAGFQQVQCMSLVGGLLGQTGFISTIIFLLFIYSLFVDSKKLNNRKFISAFLLATIVGTEISSSGLLNSAPLWYSLYLWAADYRSYTDKSLIMKGLVK